MNTVPHRLQRGLTLAELLIASTIGILVIGGAIAVFSANQTIGRTTEQYQLAQDDFRYVSQIISRVVRDGVNFAGTNNTTLVVTYPNPTGGLAGSGLRNCLSAEPGAGEINQFALAQQDEAWALQCRVGNQTPQTLIGGVVANGFTVALLKPSLVTSTLGELVTRENNETVTPADASSVEVTIRVRRPNAANDVQTRFVVTMRCRIFGSCS